MNNARFIALFAIITILSASAAAQLRAKNAGPGRAETAKSKFLPLSQVKEGMRGTARTVFKGTEPEEFNVEILGVVPGGIGPKQDLIVGRLSGGPADRTGVFAGMSGSPVYVDGKLVGAISYSFPFSKEPICGITPIEQMVSIFEKKAPIRTASTTPRKYSFGELVSSDVQSGLHNSLAAD